jgi:carbamoyl-phosphate synthase large subunit
MKNKIKLLFLSGGSLVGRNLLDVLSGRRDDLELITFNSIPNAPSLFEYDKVLISPSLVEDGDGFRKFFLEKARAEKPNLIIPCRDEDVEFLSKIKSENLLIEYPILTGSFEIASSFLDKWKSFEFSIKHDLPFAKTIPADSSEEILNQFLSGVAFPIIAKPKKGFASKGVILLCNKKQLEALMGNEDYIFQEYLGDFKKIEEYLNQIEISGIPLFHSFEELKISCQAMVGPKGELGGLLVTEHLMKQGVSASVSICKDEKANWLARGWIEKIILAGWVGPINIQFQKTLAGEYFIYEYNGRFTGATSARYHLGFDGLGIQLKLWLDESLPFANSPEICESVLRIPKSKPLYISQINSLSEQKVWEANSLTN